MIQADRKPRAIAKLGDLTKRGTADCTAAVEEDIKSANREARFNNRCGKRASQERPPILLPAPE